MGLPPSISTTRLLRGCSTLPYDIKINVLHIICRRLTQALLFRDFDIQLEIPDDRLCPPVPNRWVEIACFKVQYLICEINLDSITSSGCMTSFLTLPHKNDRPLLSVASTCTLQFFFLQCYIVITSHTLQRDRRLRHLPTTCLPPLAQLALHCNWLA